MCPPWLGLLLEMLVKAGEMGLKAVPEVVPLHRVDHIAWFWHRAELGGSFLWGLPLQPLLGCSLSLGALC